jgi:hypothetical protein
VTGVTVARFAAGKIAESWFNFDMLTLLQQVGAIPAPEQGAVSFTTVFPARRQIWACQYDSCRSFVQQEITQLRNDDKDQGVCPWPLNR